MIIQLVMTIIVGKKLAGACSSFFKQISHYWITMKINILINPCLCQIYLGSLFSHLKFVSTKNMWVRLLTSIAVNMAIVFSGLQVISINLLFSLENYYFFFLTVFLLLRNVFIRLGMCYMLLLGVLCSSLEDNERFGNYCCKS